jgi:ankyrin repeat protein
LTDGDTSTQSQNITALYAATVCDNTDVMSLLLQFGADPNQKYQSEQTSYSAIADTPLLQAVIIGSPVAVSLLIKVSHPDFLGALEKHLPVERPGRRASSNSRLLPPFQQQLAD